MASTPINLETLSLREIAELQVALEEEKNSRVLRAQVFADTPTLRIPYLASLGIELGGEFVKPGGAHDAYPLGWETTYEGLPYVATRDGANGIPGQSPDWRRIPLDGEILEWVQPHAGSEYPEDIFVIFEGFVYKNTLGSPNGFRPGEPASGWNNYGLAETFDPENPEPYEPEPEIPDDDAYPAWAPVTAGGEYPLGAIVTHNGRLWENTHPANGWEPGTTGSQWVDLGES